MNVYKRDVQDERYPGVASGDVYVVWRSARKFAWFMRVVNFKRVITERHRYTIPLALSALSLLSRSPRIASPWLVCVGLR